MTVLKSIITRFVNWVIMDFSTVIITQFEIYSVKNACLLTGTKLAKLGNNALYLVFQEEQGPYLTSVQMIRVMVSGSGNMEFQFFQTWTFTALSV